MDLTAHVTALQMALEDIAGDDEATLAMAHRMASALAPAMQLQVLDLLGEVALDVSSQLPDGRIDLQLAGRDAVLVYRAEQEAPAPRPSEDEGSETARYRLPADPYQQQVAVSQRRLHRCSPHPDDRSPGHHHPKALLRGGSAGVWHEG